MELRELRHISKSLPVTPLKNTKSSNTWDGSQVKASRKKNILKNLHHSRFNKWDTAADALKLAKRLEINGHVRTSRTYRKLDLSHWHESVIEGSRRKRARSALDMEREDALPLCVEDMEAAELRTELKSMRISATVKSIPKLRQMMRREGEKRSAQS